MDDQARLQKLLQGSEELLCVAPAVHRSADGLRSRRVWLGVGKARANSRDHFVFIFARTRVACLRPIREFVYCVLPVVQNIKMDIEPGKCVFTWRGGADSKKYQLGVRSRFGDCFIEDVQDESGTLIKVLQDSYNQACDLSLVFHEEQKQNHREIWAYRDAIPLDLAKLPLTRGLKSERKTRVPTTSSLWDDHKLRLICMTWNVGASLPNHEESLRPILEEEYYADVVVVGLQEICQLTAMRLVQDGDEAAVWKQWVEDSVQDTYEGDLEFLESCHLVGMLIMIYVRKTIRKFISNTRCNSVGIGVGGVGGNKGAVGVRMDINSTSVCFVNAHLAAGQEQYIERCQHFRTIMHRLRFPDPALAPQAAESAAGDPVASVPTSRMSTVMGLPPNFRQQTGGLQTSTAPATPTSHAPLLMRSQSLDQTPEINIEKQASVKTLTFVAVPSKGESVEQVDSRVFTISDHDHIFWLGDTNSRLHWPGKLGGMPIEQAVQKVQERRIGELLALDQLSMMRRDGLAFDGFEEHRILFLPSYKWRPETDELDMRSQKHVPAWCDRVLYRSTTRPGAEANRYDLHLGLRQSDHRPVFACFVVPWDGSRPAEERASLATLDGTIEPLALSVEPREVVFREVKPDVPQEIALRLTLQGACTSGARVKIKVVHPTVVSGIATISVDGGPLDASPQASSSRATRTTSELEAAGLVPVQAAAFVHALSATPAEASIREGKPVDVRLVLSLGEAVLHRQVLDALVLIRLNDGGPARDIVYRVPVRGQLEPSIMRLPLSALAAMGARPILGHRRATDEELVAPGANDQPLPPKEILSLMSWLLRQSSEAPPGSFDWWPHPLLDGVRTGREELLQVQQFLEQGKPLPEDPTQVLPRNAVVFLLRWLHQLPEAIVRPRSLELFNSVGREAAIRSMPALPRGVLLCAAALVAQLAARHGERSDVSPRLAAALVGSGGGSVADAERLLASLLTEVAEDAAFPPAGVIGRYMSGSFQ